MDWQLASLNGPYLGVFREAKKKDEERAASFAADAKELAAQLEILEKGTAGRPGWPVRVSRSPTSAWGRSSIACLAFPVALPAIPRRAEPGATRSWPAPPTRSRRAEPRVVAGSA